ncbi:hypothetical protein [Corynebacterium sp.]|uniref:hypothetical protein n=1 Tax=Corynebacterium sp. TaxID=1720 RepID=UPI0027B92FF0|nr:hypothetical protein [Corynebacterium sp.]
MLYAVSYAFMDSINVLSIAVIVALGVLLPAGRYKKVAPLLVTGNWFGVFALALLVTVVFSGFGELMQKILDSAAFGLTLIGVGVLTLVGTWLSKGKPPAVVGRLLGGLQKPSPMTFGIGFGLGVVQSATSGPFFAGLIVLTALHPAPATLGAGVVLYATIALSLPIVFALLVGWVRIAPHSPIGRLFNKALDNTEALSKAAGYSVGVLLIVLGALGV